METRIRFEARAIGLIGVPVVFASLALAGDFTPPPGPVGATMKSLETIEPRIPVGPGTTPGDADAVLVISEPGSYFLTGDVTGEMLKSGIRIDASDVSLDLRGFALRGVPVSFAGIRCSQGAHGLRIENGTVSDWGGDGIDALFAEGSRLSNLVAQRNGAQGIQVGHGSIVIDCRARHNTQSGFSVDGVVALDRCIAEWNGGSGFDAPYAATFTNCHAASNSGSGFVVLRGSLAHCTSIINAEAGFLLTVTGEPGDATSATNCIAWFNADGFVVLGSSVLDHCSANGNDTDGFSLLYLGTRAVVIDRCAASDNGDDGFQLDAGAVATGCQSTSNGYGYYVPRENGAARIEECSAISNTNTGFFIVGDDCFVARNMAQGNSPDYSLSGVGRYGTLVTATGTIPADPWANFGDTFAKSLPPDDPNLARKEAEAAAQREEAERRRTEKPANPTGAVGPDAKAR